DVLKAEETLYMSVVDYKSSKHSINFPDLYNGTALQMMTYLDAALSNSQQLFNQPAQPAGAFYSHVQNPFVEADDSRNKEKILQEILKKYKLDGLIVEDEELLKFLDVSLNGGEHSILYPYRQNKSGAFTSNKFITKEELAVL